MNPYYASILSCNDTIYLFPLQRLKFLFQNRFPTCSTLALLVAEKEANAWNSERSVVVHEALGKHLMPSLREMLKDIVDEYVAGVCRERL
jgi:hypothetical protein